MTDRENGNKTAALGSLSQPGGSGNVPVGRAQLATGPTVSAPPGPLATGSAGPSNVAMAMAPAAGTPSLIGEVLDGRYRLIRKLGEGGMGEVYAAEHVHIEKRLAIKLLRPEIISNQEAVHRFRQEARSASSIGHENIIAIEDFGQVADGRIYLAMELLDGAALSDMLPSLAGDPVRALAIMIQTGHGLAAAHAKGIIHRDMKPENIFVTTLADGREVPKLLDFGIAKVSGNDGGNNLTRTGTIFGTPFYMAPEQALGHAVDARTDVYAMGVILYEVFAGSLPFGGDSFMGVLTQHITSDAEPIAQRAAAAGRVLLPGLADIVARAMQKDPAHRFATMNELVAAMVQVYRQVAGAGMSGHIMSAAAMAGSSMHGGPGGMLPNGGGNPLGLHQLSGAGPAVAPHGSPAPTGNPLHRSSPPHLHGADGAAYGRDDDEFLPAKPRRAGLWVGLAMLVAGAAGAVWYTQFGPGAAATAHDVGAQSDAGGAAAVAAKKVVLVSIGPGRARAKLYDGATLLGESPINVEVVPGQPRTLSIQAEGYVTAPLVVTGETDKVTLRLEKDEAAAATTPPSGDPAVPPTQPVITPPVATPADKPVPAKPVDAPPVVKPPSKPPVKKPPVKTPPVDKPPVKPEPSAHDKMRAICDKDPNDPRCGLG